MAFSLDATQTLAAAIAVLFIGTAVQARIGFLRNNNIPVPVVGGLLFAVITTLIFLGLDLRVGFDMALKEPMMLAFFTTIGLGADFRLLVQGGPRLLLFGTACVLYLIFQDGVGLLAAVGMDLHPLVGLIGGSITLSGGHGTGAAYAQRFADVENIAGVMELAMACATFGLILGGLIGGPVAGRLIRRHGLESAASHDRSRAWRSWTACTLYRRYPAVDAVYRTDLPYRRPGNRAIPERSVIHPARVYLVPADRRRSAQPGTHRPRA